MKGRILNTKRDGRDTYVTKQTKYGTFHGKVTCADEDLDVENDLDGFIFAECKCDSQALKRRAQLMEQRAIGVEHAYNVLFKSGIDKDDPVMRKLLRQVKVAKREASNSKDVCLFAEKYFKDIVTSTIKTRRKIAKMNKEK